MIGNRAGGVVQQANDGLVDGRSTRVRTIYGTGVAEVHDRRRIREHKSLSELPQAIRVLQLAQDYVERREAEITLGE